MSDAVDIPMQFLPPTRTNPQMMLLYSAPKVGKTTAAAMLPNSLMLELEPSGADFVNARKINVPDGKTLLAVIAKLTALKAAKTPACSRLVIDTIDELEVMAKAAAFAEYKGSTLGKNFQGTDLFELDLGQGYGRLRDKVGEWLWAITKAADEIVLLAHVRDKYIDRKGVQEAASQDVDLTGKVRSLVCSRCSTIGYMRRDFADTLYVNFKTSDTINCSSRCAHLTGKEIVLGERKDGALVFHWDRIYVPDAPATPKEGA
jgi:AAA domain